MYEISAITVPFFQWTVKIVVVSIIVWSWCYLSDCLQTFVLSPVLTNGCFFFLPDSSKGHRVQSKNNIMTLCGRSLLSQREKKNVSA